MQEYIININLCVLILSFSFLVTLLTCILAVVNSASNDAVHKTNHKDICWAATHPITSTISTITALNSHTMRQIYSVSNINICANPFPINKNKTQPETLDRDHAIGNAEVQFTWFNWSTLISKLGFVLKSDNIHPNVQLRNSFYSQFPQNKYIMEDQESLSNGDADASWIDPIIDSKHPEYDINDRILGVDKNRCFIELADILMFRFLRWDGNNTKSNKRVTFPATLNMNKYVWNADGVNDSHNSQYPHFGDTGPYVYTLSFVVIHRGSLSSGHYVCLTIDSNHKCYLFDDSKYHECNGNKYTEYFGNNRRGFNAYILGYTRRNTGNKRLIAPLANGVHDNADIGTNEAMNNQSDEDDIDMNEDVNNTESHHANENVDNRRYPLRSRGKPT
eukprot:166449_1